MAHYKQIGNQWFYVWGSRSNRERASLLECPVCHKEYLSRNSQPAKTCGRSCAYKLLSARYADNPPIAKRGKESLAWKGGVKYRRGYKMIYAPDHPSNLKRKTKRSGDRLYVLEHRLVMEKKLGRYLHPFEHIHHINGVRDDNRPENLEVWIGGHPYGVRADTGKHCPTCTCHIHVKTK